LTIHCGTKIRDVFENGNMKNVEEVAKGTYMKAKIKLKIESYITKITDLNLVLQERPRNDVEVSMDINQINVTLANGAKMVEHTPENKNKYVFDLGKGSQKMVTMDNELKQGGKLEVTYQITVTNTGEVDDVTYTLVDYVDPQYSFQKEMNEGWKTSDRLREITTSVTLKKGEKATIDLKLNKILTTTNTDEYNNTVEVKQYESEEGRRIYQTIPANKEEAERDIAVADMLSIVPPTGGSPVKKYLRILPFSRWL